MLAVIGCDWCFFRPRVLSRDASALVRSDSAETSCLLNTLINPSLSGWRASLLPPMKNKVVGTLSPFWNKSQPYQKNDRHDDTRRPKRTTCKLRRAKLVILACHAAMYIVRGQQSFTELKRSFAARYLKNLTRWSCIRICQNILPEPFHKAISML